MLQVNNENQKEAILSILKDDNQTTYCSFEEGDTQNILIDGNVSFDAMKRIIEYLETKIRQGNWYRCIKDVMNNTGNVYLFKKGEYYLCPKDGVLLAEDNRPIQWQAWHNPENCFIEDVRVLR